MVMCVLENKKGEVTDDMCKPCFGFMSHINQLESSWDEDDDDEVSGEIEGFDSKNLRALIYKMDSCSKVTDKNLEDQINQIFASFPQIYSNFSVEHKGVYSMNIRAELEGQNMQTTIIGMMMLRNCYDSDFNKLMEFLIEKGAPLDKAFIMCQIFYRGYSVRDNSTMYYLVGGDSQIFGDGATVEDVRNIMNGGLGKIYQGVWGDTENGYGRYGNYNNRESPANPRTCQRCRLTDTFLMDELPENSTTLLSLLGNVGRIYGDDELIKVYSKVFGEEK